MSGGGCKGRGGVRLAAWTSGSLRSEAADCILTGLAQIVVLVHVAFSTFVQLGKACSLPSPTPSYVLLLSGVNLNK